MQQARVLQALFHVIYQCAVCGENKVQRFFSDSENSVKTSTSQMRELLVFLKSGKIILTVP
jgi:hypothetical protein